MRMRLTGLAFCCALVAASAGPASADNPGAITLIKTIQKGTTFATIDADHDGKPSVGDYSIGQVIHVSPKTGKVMGGGTAICTQINATGTRFDCQGEDHFPGGQIREAGRFTLAKTFRLAILGGTGIYQGASGELKGTWLDTKLTKARDVFTIRRG